MKTYPHVEDYIELIAGITPGGIMSSSVQISLARYDKAPLGSFITQFFSSIGLTDRQAGLALKIIQKYERQLRNAGVGLGDIIEQPRYRLPIRVVDRTRSLSMHDGKVRMRFPFDGGLIETVKKYAQESQGLIKYQGTDKVWDLDVTEHNVNFAVALGQAQNFIIDDDVMALYNEVLRVEAEPWSMELRLVGNELAVTNAPASLKEYIVENLGGFAFTNLARLVDHAPILGYDVAPELLTPAIKHQDLALTREIKIRPADNRMRDLVSYAETYNRWPIVSYRAGGGEYPTGINIYFQDHEVLDLFGKGAQKIPTDLTGIKLVHIGASTAKAWNTPIPLLICYTNMMFGSERSLLLQNAGKVCYYCDTFYKKE